MERGRGTDRIELWIATTALTHGLGVASLNRADFGRLPGPARADLISAGSRKLIVTCCMNVPRV